MVAFVIKYRDGSLAEIDIDEHTLARGRHVVPTICRERQESGEIPQGEIFSIREIVEPNKQ